MARGEVRIEFVADFSGFINPWVGLMHVARILLWRAGMVNKQLERHAYPGQASTRPRPPVRPCSCAYYVITPPPGTDHVVIPGRREGGYAHTHILRLRCPVASLFLVDYWCPHHGYSGG